ncbi:DoxX protein [Loktanella sp. 3ANDIMAR09]|uniref:DoxX family protein n=1 Tax=Loktanella sp. 3ANDIMAR09 TaxID=1225657 RepID=UPI0006F55193|nr:DoxX family membrane protein [Loktanella sp. 3ANDIMAR09]KQI68618.1 DoxX protein [Loktanella sp. 3ANDIMAR09]
MTHAALFIARFLIGFLMIGGAVNKGLGPDGAGGLLVAAGLPFWLVWPALAYNLLAGGALWLGIAVRPVAVTAAIYCAVTSFFHLQVFLAQDDPWQLTIFVKNWAIAGGCLALAVAGSGAWAWKPDHPHA